MTTQDKKYKREHIYAERVMSEHAWLFLNNLQDIENDVAPLFTDFDSQGQANKAAIILNPGHLAISCEKEINNGNPLLVYNRIYALEIPGDISSKGIINILTHSDFLSLIKSINTNWSLEWDGENHSGKLDETTEVMLTDFNEWLANEDHELSTVGVASDDLFEARFYDRENSEVDYYEDYEKITSILIMRRHIISPSTDTKLLVEQVMNSFPGDTKIHELKEYIDLHYAHVCQNVMPTTIQDWS